MSQLHTPDDLTRSLREHAERIAPEPLGVDDVRRRAAGIRRRRHGAALVAVVAGVTLAVGGPVALTARHHDPIQPTAPTPSVVLPRSVPLATADAPRGPEPAIPYAVDNAIVVPGSTTRLQVKGEITSFAPLGAGWLVSGVDDAGNGSIRWFDGDGSPVRSIPSDTLELAASPDSQAAYGDRDGHLYVTWDEGTHAAGAPADFRQRELPVRDGTQPSPVAVLGTQPCRPAGDADRECLAYWNDGEGGAYRSSAEGDVRQIEGLEKVTGVASDGRISGQVSHTDDGSCSAVLGQDLESLWETCDYSLGRFSPDGRYLLAYPAYRDGPGDTQVSVLDSQTGRALAHFDALSGGFVVDVAWESADELIALVRDDGDWHLLRLSTGGEMERATDPIQGDEYVAPVVLPARS